MRSKSTELMERISRFVDEYYYDNHTAPSTGEIAEKLGICKATAYRYLVEMNEKGMLEYDGPSRTIVTKKISKYSTSGLYAPVVGNIPCGEPENEEENIEEYINLPVSLFGRGDYYILKAAGDSMVDAGIEDGDMIVISRQTRAEVGDIVVALDESQTSTLKLYAGNDPEAGEAILQYRNAEKYAGREIRVRQLIVQGVAQYVIKSLRQRSERR